MIYEKCCLGKFPNPFESDERNGPSQKSPQVTPFKGEFKVQLGALRLPGQTVLTTNH